MDSTTTRGKPRHDETINQEINSFETPIADKLLDELEMELRKKEGIVHVGYKQKEGILFIQVHVDENADSGDPFSITKIANRHAETPVAVEIIKVSQNKPFNFAYSQNTSKELLSNERLENAKRRTTDRRDRSKSQSTMIDLTQPEHLQNNAERVAQTQQVQQSPSSYQQSDSEFFSPASAPVHTRRSSDTNARFETTDFSKPQQFSQPDETSLNALDPELTYGENPLAMSNMITIIEKGETDIHLITKFEHVVAGARNERGLEGIVNATLDGSAQINGAAPIQIEWVHEVVSSDPDTFQCSVSLSHIHSPKTYASINKANSLNEAAVRATLEALMRYKKEN